ncbi:MAG TPA: dihydroorotase [Flavipsychrobacter sp.]|nr:dihydroorotase [Flavipsychrobacter sp.]
MQVLIQQAKITDTRSGFHNQIVDILIEDGIIKDIAQSINANADTVVKADGLCVSTGWTDILADYREPGYEHKETIASGLRAAASGGYTHVLTAPNTNPAVSTKSIVQSLVQKAAGNVVSLHPLGAITQDIEGKNLAEMLDMHAHGAVAFTDGWKPVQNAQLMLKALEYVKSFNGTLVQIPVDSVLAAGGLMHEGPESVKLGMPGIPSLSETILLYRDIELLRYTGSRLHVTGISTAEGVEMIRNAKKEGLNITCSVTPYHLVLNDTALGGYSSMYKVMPPIRSEADRQALLAGIADGTIDCIASHHRPQEWDAKTKEYEYAADGMNIQEIAYNLVLQAVGAERVATLFTASGDIFGLGNTNIEKGAAADMTLYTTNGSQQLGKMQSASANNPFIGTVLQGKVIGIINNKQVHLNQ